MKALYSILATILMVTAIQTASNAQSFNVTESFKTHFNETVQAVHETENADEKRAVLDESFSKMITALHRIESLASLSEDESSRLASLKFGLTEKLNELNGLDGYDEIMDEDLNDFSNYSQNYIEQANSATITIGVSTALLILLILLLV